MDLGKRQIKKIAKRPWFFIGLCVAVIAALLMMQEKTQASDNRTLKRKSTQRAALIIGNASYNSAPLANSVNDARDMAGALKDLGFKVIIETNADERVMKQAINRFFKELKNVDLGLFFFAGHGMQINGQNYLIPINANISTETDVEYEAVNAGRVLGKMKTAGNRLNIVILDACRNNPFKRSFRTTAQGLAQMPAPKGSILAYATAPGDVAGDGSDRNGIYTKHLLKYIKQPGLTVQDFFNDAGRGVMAETDDNQIPWTSSTPIPRFYLAGGPGPGPGPNFSEQQPIKEKARLYVVALPDGSLVRILNIQEKYFDGIPLDQGRYKLEVSKQGYEKKVLWATVGKSGAVDVEIKLQSLVASETAAPPKPTLQTQPVPSPKRSFTESVTGMEFVWVKGGCYQMGDTFGEGGSYEKPVHRVCVDGFWLGKTEVTQGQWRKMMGSNPSYFKKGDNYPVEQVSWNDCQSFIKKLNSRSGKRFRLPYEAEWEYGAREGGKQVRFGTGKNAIGPNEANFDASVEDSYSRSGEYREQTVPVDSFSPNSLGLYNMSGNVWEWCQDWLGQNYYGNSPQDNPHGPSGGSNRVVRGGAWNLNPRLVRAAIRYRGKPDSRSFRLGFRLTLPSGH